MKTPPVFLGPVSELPPEGSDLEPATSSEVDACASLFSDSSIGFHISRDGVTVISNPQESNLFQAFDVILDDEATPPQLGWRDKAYDIQFSQLFRDRSRFQALSDACEPEDYVKCFLEVLAASLDDPALHEGNKPVPLVRWEAGEDQESAQVQLLGLLLADDEQFKSFCENGEDAGLIFEEAEVEARGFREVVTTVMLLGIALGSTTNAEAGLFKGKLKKKKEMRMERLAQQRAIEQAARAPIQQPQRSGWKDVHQDAYINYQLLESSSEAERKVVVDIGRQRAYLLVDGVVAIDTAVSTARSDKETPLGTFTITQRVESGKTSTIYGCDLPYWQRLDESAIGLHVGDLPGYPASAGCIRLPHSVAPVLFAHTESGTTVEVVELWDMQQVQPGQQDIQLAQYSPYQR